MTADWINVSDNASWERAIRYEKMQMEAERLQAELDELQMRSCSTCNRMKVHHFLLKPPFWTQRMKEFMAEESGLEGKVYCNNDVDIESRNKDVFYCSDWEKK